MLIEPAFDVFEDGHPRGIAVDEATPASSSRSSVDQKLSARALSYASPRLPIEGAMPASRRRREKARLVYCPGRNDGLPAALVGADGWPYRGRRVRAGCEGSPTSTSRPCRA